MARFDVDPGAIVGDDALDQRFDAAAGRLLADEPCLDDARVVEHHQVACLQQLRQIAEFQIRKCCAVDVKQTARRALVRRRLRDQLRRQVERKIGKRETGVHGCIFIPIRRVSKLPVSLQVADRCGAYDLRGYATPRRREACRFAQELSSIPTSE